MSEAKPHAAAGTAESNSGTPSLNSSLEKGLKAPASHDISVVLDQLAQTHGVNRRRLGWKADIAIVLPICMLYLLAFLDRVNISNAQVYGLSKDLHLTDMQYKTALTIFFIPYIVFEIPANYLLKRLKPHVCLSVCCFSFGAVSIGQGFVQNYSALLGTRFLLGVLETGMFPGCFYLLATWYRREEAQKRYSFFFSSTSLAGAFGGLIAYGMHQLDGRHGLQSWRWLFIIEGCITCAFGILFFFVIADFPEDAKFLKENERAYIHDKLAMDAGASYGDEKPQISLVLAVFKDKMLYLAGFMYFGIIIGAYGYALFAPTIIRTLGNYSVIKTQVWSIFPWITSFGSSMIFATASDYMRQRFIFMCLLYAIAVAGFGILLGTPANTANSDARYAACFLICVGLYSCMPLLICWCNMNFSGHYRKMVGSAWQVGFGNIGGIVSTFIFPSADAPRYKRGYSTSLGMLLFSALASSVYLLCIWLDNKKKRNGTALEEFEKLSEEEQKYAGDRNPSFIYQY